MTSDDDKAQPTSIAFPNRFIIFLDIICVVLWVYMLTKAFIVDIDSIILNAVAPTFEWWGEIRIVFFLLFFSITSIVMGLKKFIFFIAYLMLFPLIVLIIKIPLILYDIGSWIIGISAFNVILSVFTNIRYRIGSLLAYLSGILIIVYSEREPFIYVGIALLVCAVLVSYGLSFVSAFRAPLVLKLYRRVFDEGNKYIEQEYRLAEEARGVQLLKRPENEVGTFVDNLQYYVAYNRICLFSAERLRDYQRSEVGVIVGAFTAIKLIIITLLSFTAIYYGMYKVDPMSFALNKVSLFEFFSISFDSMIFGSGGAEAILLGDLPKAIAMFQRLLSLLIVIIFVSMLVFIKNKKYQRELEETVKDIRQRGWQVEKSIIDDYAYGSVDDAIIDLVKAEAAFAKFIIKMTNNLNDNV